MKRARLGTSMLSWLNPACLRQWLTEALAAQMYVVLSDDYLHLLRTLMYGAAARGIISPPNRTPVFAWMS